MDEKKLYLSFEGLAKYDELIKEYINAKATDSDGAVADEADRAQKAEKAILEALAAYKQENDAAVKANEEAIAKNAEDIAANADAIKANAEAIEVLNGDAETEGSVAKQVADAINGVVDGAPEAFDTLKEIASWISDDETGTAALVNRVAANEDNIAANAQAIIDLKDYVDAQDQYYFNLIGSIEDVKIASLFAVEQGEATAAEAIAALEDGTALKLNEDQTIAENITINKSCFIDANGATFTGTVTIPADCEVVIVNATFDKPVVVA